MLFVLLLLLPVSANAQAKSTSGMEGHGVVAVITNQAADSIYWVFSGDDFYHAVNMINSSNDLQIDILLRSNIVMNQTAIFQHNPNRHIRVFGNGFSISNSNGNTLSASGVTLFLDNVTVAGAGTGVVIQNGGHLVLYNSRVRDNAGIGVDGRAARLTMHSSEVYNNHGNAGIVMAANSEFIMHDGAIRDNSRVGVAISASTFTIHNGEVRGNGEQGISLGNDSLLTMTNGTVASNGNTANNPSEGIFVLGSRAVITNGVIRDNGRHGIRVSGGIEGGQVNPAYVRLGYGGSVTIADNGAQGILVNTGARVYIYNTAIHDNDDHGIFADNAVLTLSNSAIHSNDANGIFARQTQLGMYRTVVYNNDSTGIDGRGVALTMNESEVYNNRGNAGIVLAENGEFNMHNSEIHNNYRTGIALSGSTFTMHSGEVRHNGEQGISLTNDSLLTMESGFVINNGHRVNNLTDGIFVWDSRAIINNGIIENNGRHGIRVSGNVAGSQAGTAYLRLGYGGNVTIANNDGQGILMNTGAQVYIYNAEIHENGGNGIFSDNSTLTINGGAIRENGDNGIFASQSLIRANDGIIQDNINHGIDLRNSTLYQNGTAIDSIRNVNSTII